VHLAYWLHRCNKAVLLVDADAQRSSSLWLDGMDNAPPCRVISSPDDLLEQLPDVADDFGFAVRCGDWAWLELMSSLPSARQVAMT